MLQLPYRYWQLLWLCYKEPTVHVLFLKIQLFDKVRIFWKPRNKLRQSVLKPILHSERSSRDWWQNLVALTLQSCCCVIHPSSVHINFLVLDVVNVLFQVLKKLLALSFMKFSVEVRTTVCTIFFHLQQALSNCCSIFMVGNHLPD